MTSEVPLSIAPRDDQLWPTLTPPQIARVAKHGSLRSLQPGEVVLDAGQQEYPFFVVTNGELAVVRASCDGEQLITTYHPGSFSGELNMLAGRRSLATIRATTPSEVIEMPRNLLLALIETDADLSAILMRAFILRRAMLLDQGFGDVLILGSVYSPRTLQIREFLSRNAHPATFVDLDRDAMAQEILDHFHVSADQIPLVICRREVVLRDPTNAEIADCLGFIDAIDIDTGVRINARTIIIATGAEYRGLPIENLSKFHGAGVYYFATPMEAQLCKGETVMIVGAGNSAGQAAVYLADRTNGVIMMVRKGELADSMSRYLVRRIEENPAIEVRTRCEVVAVEGDDHLERVHCRDGSTGTDSVEPIRHLFVMTGALPATKWLEGCVALDERGFVKSGPDLTREDLDGARWPLTRAPNLLETSLPGVFAVGDVRGGNIKRVASAVGEGAIAVAFVHQVLHE